MTDNYIFIKGRRYNYYDTFRTFAEAHKIAQWQKRKIKSQYFILTVEKGFPGPRKVFKLYLTQYVRFGW